MPYRMLSRQRPPDTFSGSAGICLPHAGFARKSLWLRAERPLVLLSAIFSVPRYTRSMRHLVVIGSLAEKEVIQ